MVGVWPVGVAVLIVASVDVTSASRGIILECGDALLVVEVVGLAVVLLPV